MFFKGVRYHGKNETILIQDGYVTWRYWIRRTRASELSSAAKESCKSAWESRSSGSDEKTEYSNESATKSAHSTQKLPCRLYVKARGFQWFVYNRSPAYDTILQAFQEERGQQQHEDVSRQSSPGKYQSDIVDEQSKDDNFSKQEQSENTDSKTDVQTPGRARASTNQSTNDSTISAREERKSSGPAILNVLPLSIESGKGAIVLGNQNARSVLTVKFDCGEGTVDAKPSTLADEYKQIIDFKVVHPVVQFKHNRDYHHSHVDEGALLAKAANDGNKSNQPLANAKLSNILTQPQSFWQTVNQHLPFRSRSRDSIANEPFGGKGSSSKPDDDIGIYNREHWLGLTRYLDDDEDDDGSIEQERWKAVEYGQFPVIVDSPEIAVSFYWDAPGVVQLEDENADQLSTQNTEDINGCAPPDWGINLRVKGGTINYGPWADRQRGDIQTIFFPPLYKDFPVAERLAPGQRRVYTEMKVWIEIEEETVLRIPTREESKDWKWKYHAARSKKADPKHKKNKSQMRGGQNQIKDPGPENRPFGWLDVRVSPDSTVSVTTDLVAKSRGFGNRLNLDLRGLEVTSSVNHALLLRSQSQSITCDLGYPQEWNALRRWTIQIKDQNSEMFLLREHIFLLTDLINDWSSGPAADFYTFVPFEYSLKLGFENFKLFINANDNNIIDNPADVNDNTFLILGIRKLGADLLIPMDVFRPCENKVSFDVHAQDGVFELSTPAWNTLSTCLPQHQMASLKDLAINGSYNYFTAVSPTLTDTLLMTIEGSSPKAQIFGFLIRHFMKIKDNYFGDDIRFRTAEEYQKLLFKTNALGPESKTAEQRRRITNDLDVTLVIRARNCCAQMPSQLYSASESVDLEVHLIEADLRVTNYYMDLAVTSSPLAISCSAGSEGLERSENPMQLFIDGLEVAGHRLFGLPQAEPTYVCNWDFDVGKISGDCSISFLSSLMQIIKCFGLTFNDPENAVPALNPTVEHDVTFLRAKISPINIGLRIEEAAFVLAAGEITLNFNDWAGELCSDRLLLLIPEISLSAMETGNLIPKSRGDQPKAVTHAFCRTALELRNASQQVASEANRTQQQAHIALHDIRTQRTPWLVRSGRDSHVQIPPSIPAKVRPPAMCFPSMPVPIHPQTFPGSTASYVSSINSASSFSSTSSRPGHSFLLNAFKARKAANAVRGDITPKISTAQGPSKESAQWLYPSEASTRVIPGDVSRDTSRSRSEDGRHRDASALGFSFTSPYKRPSFPILSLKPDIKQLPRTPKDLAISEVFNPHISKLNVQNSTSTDAEEDSLMIKFNPGLEGFCTPKALFLVTKLLENVHARNPEILLDNLQIDALTEVLHIQQKRDGIDHTLNIRAYCPFVTLKFLNTVHASNDLPIREECYDFSLQGFHSTVRISDLNSQNDQLKPDRQIALHASLDKVNCSARESVEGFKDEQAVVRILVHSPTLWLFLGSTLSSGAQFKNVEFISASRRVDYMSSLVRQTLMLSEALAERFSAISWENANRLRLLIFLLSQASGNTTDPPFLSATSYLLRGDVEHLRSSDSWKMISRLRYVFRRLSPDERNSMIRECTDKTRVCPESAFSTIIKTFEKWRAWEFAQARPSILIGKVFGKTQPWQTDEARSLTPSKASILFENIRVLVDPGPHQNEIIISRSVIGLSLFQGDPHIKMSKTSAKQRERRLLSRIEAHFGQVALRLNWSLCELIENVIQTVREHPPARSMVDPSAAAQPQPDLEQNWHVIISTEHGLLNLDTPSIKLLSACQHLRLSTVLMVESPVEEGFISLAIHAEAASSELRDRAKPLTLYRLWRPSIVGSRSSGAVGNVSAPRPWRFVGSGRETNFQIVANVLDVTQTVENFVKNEGFFIASWIDAIQPHSSRPKVLEQGSTSGTTGLLKAHVTLFLDSYFVTVAVLPALIYKIHGTGGRTSIKSGIQQAFSLDLDIDIHDHAHVFSNGLHKDSEELSVLQIPPINGRIATILSPKRRSVTIRALAEPILFEASAIHSLIDAINRPEIVNLGANVSHEVSLIQQQIEKIFHTKKSTTKHTAISPPPVVFDAFATLAGLAVHASTPDSSVHEYVAELEFNMGRILMKASNKENNTAPTFPLTKIDVTLEDVRLRLMRSNETGSIPCGEVAIGIFVKATLQGNELGNTVPSYQIDLQNPSLSACMDTASVITAVASHLQNTLKTIEVSDEVRRLGKRGYSRLLKDAPPIIRTDPPQDEIGLSSTAFFNGANNLEISNLRLVWRVDEFVPTSAGRERENLTVAFRKIELATRKGNAARLSIQDFQLEMAPPSQVFSERASNSALLPEVVFNVAYLSTPEERRLAFQAKGKALDLRLTSQFLLPANDLRRSIARSIQQVRNATENWNKPTKSKDTDDQTIFGSKRLGSLLIDAEFAGAVVYVQGRAFTDPHTAARRVLQVSRQSQHGKYNQFTPDNSNSSTVLRAPGIAMKVEYKNSAQSEASLNAEVRVDASSNTLYPSVVPLVLEISASVKEIVGDPVEQAAATHQDSETAPGAEAKHLEDGNLSSTDPLAVFEDCSINFGLRICAQEFSLSCQPIARVAATARFEDFYLTVNTVKSAQHGKFFAFSTVFTGLQTAIQHVYSRESTGGITIDSVVLSLMNSKHFSDASGISAILNTSPMKVHVNAKQSQDFLLFREIWLPAEIRKQTTDFEQAKASEPQSVIVQRYQQVAATGAFPWNATVSIAALEIQIDLGQSLGKSVFSISDFWVSSTKSSDWEQTLCLGFEKVGVESMGRMSGNVELRHFRVGTSIKWPLVENPHNHTPLIQASTSFDHLEVKAGFDYQAFFIANVSNFEFLMYNVRNPDQAARDRLVGMLDGDRVQAFCTTSSASQAIALYQAFQRLIQEKQTAYEASLKDIEKYLRRKSSVNPFAIQEAKATQKEPEQSALFSSLKLQTNVVVNLRAIDVGAFPSTFFDSQIFRLEALDASARFAVVIEANRIHSTLSLLLGELRIALAAVSRPNAPKSLSEVTVANVLSAAASSRGGTILKVPKVIAEMQTWQDDESTWIDYIFRSSFQGKVDVGWNYSRISYIRGMWNTHVRALAQRLGKPLPSSAVQITGLENQTGDPKIENGEQEKITAVVNVPQSKYQYNALQTPIIETPQLRDMGEATPPLEWIGLHRERLPNLTHQIVIVSLLRVAKDIDDAYTQILGSS